MKEKSVGCWGSIILGAVFILLLTVASNTVAEADEFCWKQSNSRALGRVLHSCDWGYEKQGASCFKKCADGWEGADFLCKQKCPAGFRNDPLHCGKPAPLQDLEYPWRIGDTLLGQPGAFDNARWRCEHSAVGEARGGCDFLGAIYYPKCPSTHTRIGVACSPKCPAGSVDIGVSCQKATVSRENTRRSLECIGDMEMDGGLCYPKCDAGFYRIGSVCWQQCTEPLPHACGGGCATDEQACAAIVTEQVMSVVQVVLDIAMFVGTGGLANAAMTAAKVAKSLGKNASEQIIKKSIIIAAKKVGKEVAETVAQNVAVTMAAAALPGNDSMDLTALTALDPTGLSDIALAYAHDVCPAPAVSVSSTYIYDYRGGSGAQPKQPPAAHFLPGTLWAIGPDAKPGGYGIYYWGSEVLGSVNAWTAIDGGAVNIAVDPYGNPWVVNDKNKIFRRKGGPRGTWEEMGTGKSVAIGSDGIVWMVKDASVHHWDESEKGWKEVEFKGYSPPQLTEAEIAEKMKEFTKGCPSADPRAWQCLPERQKSYEESLRKTHPPDILDPGKFVKIVTRGEPSVLDDKGQVFSRGGELGWRKMSISLPGPVDPDGYQWLIKEMRIYRNQNFDSGKWAKWIRMPGLAQDIAFAKNPNRKPATPPDEGKFVWGAEWVLGEGEIWGGFKVYNWDLAANKWEDVSNVAVEKESDFANELTGNRQSSQGVRLAVDPKGNPWVVDSLGRIYRRVDGVNGLWRRVNGTAKDIDIGGDGRAWIIGTDKVSGGYSIHFFAPSKNDWVKVDGGAVNIAVDPEGVPWVVSDAGQIWRRAGGPLGSWALVDGKATDIAISGNGSKWIVGTHKKPGGFGIHVRENNSWKKIGGGAVRIAAGPQGAPWVVNDGGDIFRREGGVSGKWVSMPGKAKDIAIGKRGPSDLPPGPPPPAPPPVTVAKKDVESETPVEIPKEDPAEGASKIMTEEPPREAGDYVLADDEGKTWAIGTDVQNGGYGIHFWAPSKNKWVKIHGGAVKIAVDPAGNPWVVNSFNQIFRREGGVNGKWVRLPGAGNDISIGTDGQAWLLGNLAYGAYRIYVWENDGWRELAGLGANALSVGPDGNPWIIGKDYLVHRRDGGVNGKWVSMPGKGTDIAVGGNGQAWFLGIGLTGGINIYAWDQIWRKVDGSAQFISADADGNPWVGNANGQIFRREGGVNGKWVGVPGTARDIAFAAIGKRGPSDLPASPPPPSVTLPTAPQVSLTGLVNDIAIGANGAAWAFGTNTMNGGYGIWYWNTSTNNWSSIDGAAVRMAVDPRGNPWVVNSFDQIFRRDGGVNGKWVLLPGKAKDIGIGANGSVWIIGANALNGGFGIYAWQNNAWKNIDGAAVRIAVDPQGNPWVVNSNDDIFRREGGVNGKWVFMPGQKAKDIGIGANTWKWIIGANPLGGGYGIFYWDESKNAWVAVDGAAINISVGPQGNPWVVNDSNVKFRRNGLNGPWAVK